VRARAGGARAVPALRRRQRVRVRRLRQGALSAIPDLARTARRARPRVARNRRRRSPRCGNAADAVLVRGASLRGLRPRLQLRGAGPPPRPDPRRAAGAARAAAILAGMNDVTVIPAGGGEVVGDSPERRVEILSDDETLAATWSRFGPRRDGADLHVH